MKNEIPTSAGKIVIVKALPPDLDKVMHVLDSAAEWLISKGIQNERQARMWPREKVVEHLERGEVYLASFRGQTAATISLQWNDEIFWPGYPKNAAYVHRLAVASEFHGHEIGRKLVEWAERKALENGKSCLRLNCLADNRILRRYYEIVGFAYQGETEDPRGWRAALYEKKLLQRTPV